MKLLVASVILAGVFFIAFCFTQTPEELEAYKAKKQAQEQARHAEEERRLANYKRGETFGITGQEFQKRYSQLASGYSRSVQIKNSKDHGVNALGIRETVFEMYLSGATMSAGTLAAVGDEVESVTVTFDNDGETADTGIGIYALAIQALMPEVDENELKEIFGEIKFEDGATVRRYLGTKGLNVDKHTGRRQKGGSVGDGSESECRGESAVGRRRSRNGNCRAE